MRRLPRVNAVSMAALVAGLIAMLASVAAAAAQAPLIFPKGAHIGRTVTGGSQRPVAPVGKLRVVKPVGGSKPPARTIFAKRPS